MRWSLIILLLAGSAWAGFLPLVHDRPKRDNPNDPAVHPLALPTVIFPTVTSTATAVPACTGVNPDNGTFATFEAGTESWVSESAAGYAVMAVAAGAPSCFGTQSLGGTATLAHAGGTLHLAFKKDFSADWTGRTLVERVYLPAGYAGSSADAYVKVTSGYVQHVGPLVPAPAGGGWVTVTFALGGLSVSDQASVMEAGVDIFSGAGDPDGSVTYRIDSVSLVGGPTPTATSTPLCGSGSDSAYYDGFESGVDTWTYETAGGYTAMAVTNGTPSCLGSLALDGAATLTHAGTTLHLAFKKDIPTKDATGMTLTAEVYFPAGYPGSTANAYVKVTSGFTYHSGALVASPSGGGWATVTFNLSSLVASDQAALREVGVDLFSSTADPDGAVTYCVDSVALH